MIEIGRRFGVELEFSDKNVKNELYFDILMCLDQNKIYFQNAVIRGWEHTRDNYCSWVVKDDSSCGYEVCTPIMSGDNDLFCLELVVDFLKKRKRKYNLNCGLHVHASISDYDHVHLNNLIRYWIKCENALYDIHPYYRRMNERFCGKLLKKYCGHMEEDVIDDDSRDLVDCIGTYRASISLKDAVGSNPTVEWRMGEMTLNNYSIQNRIKFFLHFIEMCKILPKPSNMKNLSVEQMKELFGISLKNKNTSKICRWIDSRYNRYNYGEREINDL